MKNKVIIISLILTASSLLTVSASSTPKDTNLDSLQKYINIVKSPLELIYSNTSKLNDNQSALRPYDITLNLLDTIENLCSRDNDLEISTGLNPKPNVVPKVEIDIKPEDSIEVTPDTTTVTAPKDSKSLADSYEEGVLELVNVHRIANVLEELKINPNLSKLARIKSQDMADNDYLSHESPTYGQSWDMLNDSGIEWSCCGENIASGQRTSEEVVTDWMNSPGHRANILEENFTEIGIGYAVNKYGVTYWTQIFMAPW